MPAAAGTICMAARSLLVCRRRWIAEPLAPRAEERALELALRREACPKRGLHV